MREAQGAVIVVREYVAGVLDKGGVRSVPYVLPPFAVMSTCTLSCNAPGANATLSSPMCWTPRVDCIRSIWTSETCFYPKGITR